jgi:predicted nucleic acid-binding Zn ribbon protein
MSTETERNCANCGKALVGAQRTYCSNACKQAIKYRRQRQSHAELRSDNARLRRKVKRLENKLAKLTA